MKKVTLILFFLVMTFFLKATHNRAGEVLYKRIVPFTAQVGSTIVNVYTYSITIIKYTNNGLNVADRCLDTVYFGDGSKDIAPRINGSSACSCGTLNGNVIGCGEIIINNLDFVVKKNIYSIIHTYAGSGTFIISSADPNRNAGVINISNASSVPFYMESMLVISNSLGANTSPESNFIPVDLGLINQCYSYNSGTNDIDGDSLSYELMPCQSSHGQTLVIFSYPACGTGGSFSMNPVSGTLFWCVPQMIGEYNFGIRINEWRKNSSSIYQKIGYVNREMQVLVKTGVVGISENFFTEDLVIYPNPFLKEFKIDLGSTLTPVDLSIYSTSGALVYKIAYSSEDKVVKLENLKSGMYTLRIETKNGLIYKKLVKE